MKEQDVFPEKITKNMFLKLVLMLNDIQFQICLNFKHLTLKAPSCRLKCSIFLCMFTAVLTVGLTHFNLVTPKRVIGKQYRSR